MGTNSPLNERHLLIEIHLHTKPNPPVSTVLMLRPCAEGIVYTVRRGWAYEEKRPVHGTRIRRAKQIAAVIFL